MNLIHPWRKVTGGLSNPSASSSNIRTLVRVKELSGIGGLEEINRLGGANLSGFKELFSGGAIRVNQPDASSSSVVPFPNPTQAASQSR